MKLKQFLQPADSYFSTPKAARRLLRLFAQILVLGAIAGAIITLSTAFNSEISRRQRYMSDAITSARVLFTQREALLRYLVLSVVDDSGTLAEQTPAQKKINAEEGIPAKDWALHLPERMISVLTESRINLVYVDEPGTAVVYLSKSLVFQAPLSDQVIRRLHEIDTQALRPDQQIWISDQYSIPPRLYLFTLADPDRLRSGWIGMEMDASDVTNTLHDDTAGQFMMLNPNGDVMMSSASVTESTAPTAIMEINKTFGLAGAGVVPDKMVMRKKLGYSDWTVFYSIDLFSLLSVFYWPFVISLAVILLTALLVYRLVSRIERRLIEPATQRIDALIESEAFSRAVIQAAPVALCVLRRADGQVVLENRLSEQWLGECNERERLCHRWIEQAFDNNESNRSDEFQAGNGRHLYLSFVKTRYNGEDVLFCAFADFSTRKQVEAAMAEAKKIADAANEAKTLFLATMSHEIRTPLYGVLGTLELLAKTELKSQQKAYLHAIESSSSALLNLVCDVLDVAKIEAGQLALDVQEFSPVELVCSVVQSYAGAARSKGVMLYSYIDHHTPDVLRGDVTRIRQILNNLLSNAVKFTDSGQVVLRVKLGADADQAIKINWQISDSGPGIAVEDQTYLFDPFYQTGSSTNVIAGTGLGLSICKRLAELMGGSIRVVSMPGLGSSFTLGVTLERVQPAVEVKQHHAAWPNLVYVCSPALEMSEYIAGWLRNWGAMTQAGPPGRDKTGNNAVLLEIHLGKRSRMLPEWEGPRIVVSLEEDEDEKLPDNQWNVSLNDLSGLRDALRQAQGVVSVPVRLNEVEGAKHLGLKILVAEDNVINQLILKDQLEALGCQVALTGNASEALMLWSKEDFDVVLTDINMPGINGYDLAKELRSLGCGIPIIGATANAMRDESDRCLSAGMQGLLVKPFGLGTLYSCLEHYKRACVDGL
ncbi:ATP-binding protein [Pseudomonas sp. GZD-222]|uniref:ATP-binding protein n=1 Tax=Pseudomonas sp. GZD-222 TaxID=3404805 RepID=UPI003BB5818F